MSEHCNCRCHLVPDYTPAVETGREQIYQAIEAVYLAASPALRGKSPGCRQALHRASTNMQRELIIQLEQAYLSGDYQRQAQRQACMVAVWLAGRGADFEVGRPLVLWLQQAQAQLRRDLDQACRS